MIYTLKNRYREPFTGMFDGQLYTVSDTLAVPDFVALHLKNQAVIKDNPITGERQFRLAILELNDPVESLDALPVETLDRSDMDMPKVRIVPTHIRTAAPQKSEVGPRNVVTDSKER